MTRPKFHIELHETEKMYGVWVERDGKWHGFYVVVSSEVDLDKNRAVKWKCVWKAWSHKEGGNLARAGATVYTSEQEALLGALDEIENWGPYREDPLPMTPSMIYEMARSLPKDGDGSNPVSRN